MSAGHRTAGDLLATHYDLVVRADRAVLPDGEQPVAVGVNGGRITLIADRDEPLNATETVELDTDEVLVPGLVDTHVHINEPGRTEWEGFETATRAALAGGVTTVIDMPLNSLPPTVNVAALDVKRAAAEGKCHVNVGFWGGAIPGNQGDLPGLHDAGVFGFKCFLADSGVPEFPPVDSAQLTKHLEVIADLGAMLIVHAEDAGVLAGAPHVPGRRYADFLASRPHEAEDAAIAEVLDAARRTGARVHILHLSSADALPMLAAAKADGVRVSVETCPHYLCLDAEHVPSGATQFKCCPPIRDQGNQDALWQGLREGIIDVIVSDHSPCLPELKRLEEGDFEAAWGGIASLQVSFPAIWTAARERGHSLGDVIGWMSSRPAALAGVPGKGAIAVGMDADLVAFAPDDHQVIDPHRLHHRNPVTPYADLDLQGRVRASWLQGRRTDADEGSEPLGAFLTRGPARDLT